MQKLFDPAKRKEQKNQWIFTSSTVKEHMKEAFLMLLSIFTSKLVKSD